VGTRQLEDAEVECHGREPEARPHGRYHEDVEVKEPEHAGWAAEV
jgi:hypothetical protein